MISPLIFYLKKNKIISTLNYELKLKNLCVLYNSFKLSVIEKKKRLRDIKLGDVRHQT
jgi:hypothetical protein